MVLEPEEVILLRDCFERNGCLRIREDDPERKRHGGVELRLVATSPTERREMLQALSRLEIPHGRVYQKEKKRRQWVIPIYARLDVVKFLRVVRPEGFAALVRRVKALSSRPLQSRRRRRRGGASGPPAPP